MADTYAEIAHRLSDPGPEFEIAYRKSLSIATRVLEAHAAMLPLFPSNKELHGTLSKAGVPKVPKIKQALKTEHMFFWTGSLWRCVACLYSTPSRTPSAATWKCPGHSSVIRDMSFQANAKGHKLHVGKALPSQSVVLVCSRCGCWAEKVPKLLIWGVLGLPPQVPEEPSNLAE